MRLSKKASSWNDTKKPSREPKTAAMAMAATATLLVYSLGRPHCELAGDLS